MHNDMNRLRNMELPENLFSNLGETKKYRPIVTNDEDDKDILESYNIDSDLKLTPFVKRNEYRDRITKMYDDIEDLTPIDGEIDNVLYFNNYVEKGIVIKPKLSSLKQFWTEYRLIKNEKTPSYKKHRIKENGSLSNFDELFSALSQRVKEINKYIDELKEMRTNIDISNNKLEEEKKDLKNEKKKFQDYKTDEEKKLKQEKDNLKVNYDRLQTIINDLDKKLNEIEK